MSLNMKRNEYTLKSLLPVLMAAFLVVGCGEDDDNGPNGPDGIPCGLHLPNGTSYKGVMGSSTLDKPLEFGVADKDGKLLPSRWVHFKVSAGDGTLSADSIKTGSDGIDTLEYIFDGSLGHADIELMVRGIDTQLVKLRANTLIIGDTWQGQYILSDETYGDVKIFNGQPASVDVDPHYWIVYGNYEAALGVVFIIEDTIRDEEASDDEPVIGIIVNSIYEHKTADSIGLGSSIDDLRAVYGEPHEIDYDPAPPPAVTMTYPSLGLYLYADPDDTTLFEIHLGSPWVPQAAGKMHALDRKPSRRAGHQAVSPVGRYRLTK